MRRSPTFSDKSLAALFSLLTIACYLWAVGFSPAAIVVAVVLTAALGDRLSKIGMERTTRGMILNAVTFIWLLIALANTEDFWIRLPLALYAISCLCAFVSFAVVDRFKKESPHAPESR